MTCVMCGTSIYLFLKSGFYAALMEKVEGFRVLIGAPDMEKFNIVLLGGISTLTECSCYVITLMRISLPPSLPPSLHPGLLGSLFSFLQFLASPLIGATSDIYGRKKVLVLSMVRWGVMGGQ